MKPIEKISRSLIKEWHMEQLNFIVRSQQERRDMKSLRGQTFFRWIRWDACSWL